MHPHGSSAGQGAPGTDPASIEQWLQRGDTAALGRVMPEDIRAFLRGLFQANEQPGGADVDRLIGTGAGLGRAAIEDADEVALEWLEERPSPERLDVVAAFLDGFWAYLPRFGPGQDSRIERFIALGETMAADPEVEYGFLRALGSAVRDDAQQATRARLRPVLEAARTKRFGAALQPLVTSLLDRVLARADPWP